MKTKRAVVVDTSADNVDIAVIVISLQTQIITRTFNHEKLIYFRLVYALPYGVARIFSYNLILY